MTTGAPLLELDAVEVRYGAVPAVRDLSLEIGGGEIVGLIGPNGAGKSTALHAIMGLVPTTSGSIKLRGAALGAKPPEAVARLGIALVPEGRRIFAELTVGENLRLGLAGRRSRAGADEDLDAVQELFPVVREFRGRQAGALSVDSSNSLQSHERSLRSRTSFCSTSLHSGWRRGSSTSSSTRSRRSGGAVSPCSSSSSERSARSRSPIARI